MKTIHRVAIGCLTVILAAGATARAEEEGIRAAALEELVKRIEEVAEIWRQDRPDADTEPQAVIDLERRIKAVTYDEKSIEAFSKQLKTSRKDPVNLYVANKLIAPLLLAKTEVVRKALPTVRLFQARFRRYSPLPKHSARFLRSLQYPKGGQRKSQEHMLRIIARVDKAREAKLARERVILLHNRQVFRLETMTVKVMVLADDPEEDRKIIAMLTAAEKQGSWAYAEIVAILRAQAGKVSPQRAEFFYDALSLLGEKLHWERKSYTHPCDAALKANENSTFVKKAGYPGVRLLGTANQFAPAARQPALKTPTKKQVDAYVKAQARKKKAAAAKRKK